MHSLPSRRRLSQPIFFRFKCYRLSPLPVPRPPASVPAPALLLLPRLLPASGLPVSAPPPVPAAAHTLPHALAHAAAHRQPTRRRPAACGQTSPRTPGTVEWQAGARLDGGAVGRQGRRTFSQSANRDSVISPLASLKSHEDHLPHIYPFLWSS